MPESTIAQKNESIKSLTITRVAIYTRVSTRGQVDNGLSLEAQEKACIQIAERNGWRYKVYQDAGKSAASEKLDGRDAILEILDLVHEKKISYVITTEIDRLSRHPATLDFIKRKLVKNDVKVVTLGQTYDFANEAQDFMSDLLGIMAKYENRLRSTRAKRGMREAVLRRRWHGGIPPFGYDVNQDAESQTCGELVVNKEEARIYRKMVRWRLRGIGTNNIARKLNQEGTPTKGSKIYKNGIFALKRNKYDEIRLVNPKQLKWRAGTVLGILRNPLYKGERHFLELVIEAPAIIPDEEWEELQAYLTQNNNNPNRNRKRFYLLKGLLKCKRCSRNLYGVIKPKKGMRLYSCASKRYDPEYRFCGLKNVNLDRLNELVWSNIRRLIMNSNSFQTAVKKGHSLIQKGKKDEIAEIKDLLREKEQVERAIARLIKLYAATKAITVEQLDNEVNTLKETLFGIEKRLEKLEVLKVDSIENQFSLDSMELFRKELAECIDNLTDEERFDLLHLILSRIEVDYVPEKGHKIEIIWAIQLPDPTSIRGSITPLKKVRSKRG